MRNKNNNVEMSGEILENLQYSHELYGERFYRTIISTIRKSGAFDEIPVIVSDRAIDTGVEWANKEVRIAGQFRSYNQHADGRNRLLLFVFPEEVELVEMKTRISEENSIYLDGHVCRTPTYRKSPLGRDITDIILAVNRAYGKTDYIPCVCWGRNAKWAAGLEIGARLDISGRIQSRQYIKKIGECSEIRTAYEVSISNMELLADSK